MEFADYSDAYANTTHASPSWMIRHAHQKRLEVAAQLIGCAWGTLDWGAGDGMLAKLLHLMGNKEVMIYEPVELFHKRLLAEFGEDWVAFTFDEIADMRFEAIACLEVMEHMSLRNRLAFYAYVKRALRPSGLCVVSVPVEIGPAVLIKEFGRVVIKRRQLSCKLATLLKASLGIVHRDPARFGDNGEEWIHEHAGFDYRAFRKELREHFRIEREIATPLGGPPWLLNQTVTFALRLH